MKKNHENKFSIFQLASTPLKPASIQRYEGYDFHDAQEDNKEKL